MNHALVNSRISQLPIAMAGIVHAFFANGICLSIYDDTIDIREKTPASTATDCL